MPGAAAAPATQRARLWLLALLVALVTHGSLFPWRFVAPPALGPAMAPVFGAGALWTGWADVVGNLLLFAPLGLLAWCVTVTWRPAARHAWLWGGGVAFAWSLQALQVFLPARDPAWSDGVWNLAGLALGAAAGQAAPRLWQALPPTPAGRRAPWLLAAVWLAIEWWPLLPSWGRRQWIDVITPLLLEPHLSLAAFAQATLAALALAALLMPAPQARGSARAPGIRPAYRIAVLLGLGMAGKLLVWGQAWSLSHLAGLVCGLAAAAWLGSMAGGRAGQTEAQRWARPGQGHPRLAARGAAAATLLWFSAEALRPWQLAPWAEPMVWMPFAALLRGDLLFNLLALGWNAFWLGVVMCALACEGRATLRAALALAAWVLLLEAVQTRLPGRVPDASTAALPLLWWLTLQALPAEDLPLPGAPPPGAPPVAA